MYKGEREGERKEGREGGEKEEEGREGEGKVGGENTCTCKQEGGNAEGRERGGSLWRLLSST